MADVSRSSLNINCINNKNLPDILLLICVYSAIDQGNHENPSVWYLSPKIR
jgi:hypothetical protein